MNLDIPTEFSELVDDGYSPTCSEAGNTGSAGSHGMTSAPDGKLSPSENRTLQDVAEGELDVTEMDWVALQRLKKLTEDKMGSRGLWWVLWGLNAG